MRFRKHDIFLIIGILCLGIIVMLLLMTSNKKLSEINIQNDLMYTFIGERKVDIDGKIIYDYESNTTKLEAYGEKITFDTIPLYYQEKDGLIFPKMMNSVNIYTGSQARIPYYTQVVAENGDYYYRFNNKKTKINNSFVYDGNDLYVFFAEVEVNGGEEYFAKLPALSYIEYNYNKELYVFNYAEKEVKKIDNVDDLIVKINGMTINLKSDSIESDDFNRILIKNFGNLKTIDME